ncbi:MAG TPA: serine/threonine protein kinase [Candidatus Paceibacterota bacterium]|nr:serine/threonine protein kinase [Candidatus Paceibacterota bacterium]
MKQPIWILPLALAGLVAALGWWGNVRLRDTIDGQLKAQLSATLNANVTALGIWTTNQTRLATSLAEDPVLRTLASRILQSPPATGRNVAPSPELEQFDNDLRLRLPQLGYENAQLVNTNFRVVAISRIAPGGGRRPPFTNFPGFIFPRFNFSGMTNFPRPQFPGMMGNMLVSDAHTNKFAELFASGEPVIITPFKPDMPPWGRGRRSGFGPPRTNGLRGFFSHPPPPFAGRPRRGDRTLMQVAAPIRNETNGIVGALALIINPDDEFSKILSVARVGASGETYAFDQTGLMISQSRFNDQLKQLGLLEATNDSSALNLRLHDPGGDLTTGFRPNSATPTNILISLVTSALDGEETVQLEPSRDYRGVPVVGASLWLPQFGFGVATQMDADEAYRPLRILQMVFVVLILGLLLCATGLFVFSNLTWRRRLSEAELKLKQLGQYTLEEKIGEGGMGVVYRARHALLRRDTAVKLLLPDRADPASVARFEKEVQLTCQLTHPNTIQVYDYGHTPEGIFYYAMEFLRGLNLHELVARYGPQPEGRVVHILAQVCDSLAEAHAVGLIHRDIKPANVFLCSRGGVPDCVKVLDFGLVREFRADDPQRTAFTQDNVIEGTPWFTPPEAINGSGLIDPRSDLYAVGALGYFLLTGQYIFDAETVSEIHAKQLASAPIPPRHRTANPISSEMEQIILRCLEKDAALRPQSAGVLKTLLLTSAAAADWKPEARLAWWNSYQHQAASHAENVANPSTPMATVKIELSRRLT